MATPLNRIPSADRQPKTGGPRARILQWFAGYERHLMLAWGVLFLILGWVGFTTYNGCCNNAQPFPHNLYQALQLFALNSVLIEEEPCVPWMLQLARFLAPALTFYAAIRALLFILSGRVLAMKLLRSKNHIVICGLGRRGYLFAKDFLGKGERVVVIEENPGNKYLNRCRDEGALVVEGNATDLNVLARARVERAKYLIAVCGSDSTNADIATNAEMLVSRKGGSPTCFIHIFDPNLCSLLVEQALSRGPSSPRLEFFNIYDFGARSIIAKHPGFGKIDDPTGRPPHLLVIGAGRMGQSLIYHAAHSWWIKNRGAGQKMKVTAIDKEAIRKADSLRLRFPQLAKSCEIIPLQIDVNGPEFHRATFLWDTAKSCVMTGMVISFDDDSRSLSTALNMMQHLRDCPVPLIVRMMEEAGLASLIEHARSGGSGLERMETFALMNRTCTEELLTNGVHELIAQGIHEVYLRTGYDKGETPTTNPSIVPWDMLPEHLKESNRLQADDIPNKLRAIGCAIVPLSDWEADRFVFDSGEVEKMAEMEHERWCGEKLAKMMTHDCQVPWSDLPEETKDKDRETVRAIPEVLARAGLQVYRRH